MIHIALVLLIATSLYFGHSDWALVAFVIFVFLAALDVARSMGK